MCLIVWWTKITFSTWFLKNHIPCTISEDLKYKRRIMSHSYALISHSFFFRPLEIPFYFLWSIDVFLFPYCKTFFPYFYLDFFPIIYIISNSFSYVQLNNSSFVTCFFYTSQIYKTDIIYFGTFTSLSTWMTNI